MTPAPRAARDPGDPPDPASLRLARRVVRGLAPLLTHVVVAPGSRSAPMAYALVEAEGIGGLRVLVRTDERSAAFTALGIGRVEGCAAAVLTTSGTAVGNLLPALMEADMGAAPLVAITADRPERLHGTGANQTTWQRGMFSGRVRGELHIDQNAVDQNAVETRVRDLVSTGVVHHDRGILRRGNPPGPVHLNIGFDDPLVPAEAIGTRPAGQSDQRRRPQHPGPSSAPSTPASGDIVPGDQPSRRTLFIAGDRAPCQLAGVIDALGQPLIAEPTSGLRSSDHGAVPGYRLILQAPAETWWGRLAAQVERVVVLGRPTLSRPVQRLLARPDVQAVQFSAGTESWYDPERLGRAVISEIDAELLEFAGTAPPDWTESWQRAGRAAQELIDAELSALPRLSSVRAAQYVAETVQTPLLLGSSSVIRDVDLAAGRTAPQQRDDDVDLIGGRIGAMRGLAGIDGNISAAAGLAVAARRRVTALVGDLTFLHDLNALLIPATEEVPELDVVVVNDRGGAIFDQLEHGAVARRPGQADVVERLFGTPQTAEMASLVRGYGHEHLLAETTDELGAALADPAGRGGIRVIEVRTDRGTLRDLHARLAARAPEL